jgi:type I restriction enzyme M protein
VRRLVVCQKELKLGDKGAYKMRDHDQAAKDLELLKDAMAACENCKYGLWTNGLEFFFFQVKRTKFDVKFIPIGDWPLSDDSIGTRDVASHAKLRRADPEMLRTAFRRCHNFIHGNEGMPKDAAFWQFLYLIFAKMHDERQPNDKRAASGPAASRRAASSSTSSSTPTVRRRSAIASSRSSRR